MKTPISYYGGKQKLVTTILPLIPEHTLYNEPFAGGAAIFFAKPSSEIEVLNDTKKELITFYRVVQNDYINLEKEIRITLHSRTAHEDARVVVANPHLFSDLKIAWAIYVLSSQSFASKLDGSWGYDKTRNTMSKKVQNKKDAFTEDYAARLQNVQLECSDAVYIISSRDHDKAFHYCDPPYFNSDCGHYKGYTEQDMEKLLKTLAGVKGKFLLSSYPSELLDKYVKKYGWPQITKDSKTSVATNYGKGKQKMKTEVLTANYDITNIVAPT